MTLELRAYQQDVFDRVRTAFGEGARSVVMQMPTGAGKTRVFAEILKRCVARGGQRALFLAHLDTLLDDTIERLRADNVHAGLVQAARPSDPTAPVQVASLQTLHVRGERPPANLVILDECHRAQAASVRDILDAYEASALLGGTATPQRGDGRPLGDVFERLIEGPSVRALTALGHLVPCDLLAPGEFKEGELAMDPVAAYQAYTPGRRAIVFAANAAHAEDLTRRFNEAGYAAGLVLGDTPRAERVDIRTRLRSGELLVLVGVGVFVEGFDEGSIEVVVLARAFGVCGPYLQSIGRGLRPWAPTGKTRCTVIDLRGAVYVHGLPDEDRIWSIDGHAVRRAEKITALMRCRECLAVFRPCSHCPRCGAVMKGAPRIPRVLTRPERLASFSDLPQVVRDYRYLEQLERVARQRMRKSDIEAAQWALVQFRKRFGREPERGAAA